MKQKSSVTRRFRPGKTFPGEASGEMELLRQIEGLKKSLDSSTTQMGKKALRQQLSEKLTNLNMRMEHNRKVRQT
jgi:hypothetical protein